MSSQLPRDLWVVILVFCLVHARLAAGQTTTELPDGETDSTNENSVSGTANTTESSATSPTFEEGNSTDVTDGATDSTDSPVAGNQTTTDASAGNATDVTDGGSTDNATTTSIPDGENGNSTDANNQTSTQPSATLSPTGLSSIANSSVCRSICDPPACQYKNCTNFNATCVMDPCQCTARFVVFRTNTELLDVTEFCGVRSYTPGTWRLPPLFPVQKPVPVDESNRVQPGEVFVIDGSQLPTSQGQSGVDASQQPATTGNWIQPVPENWNQQPQNTLLAAVGPESAQQGGVSPLVQQRLPFALNSLLSALPNVIGLTSLATNFPIPGFGPASQVAGLRPGMSSGLIGDSEDDVEHSAEDWEDEDDKREESVEGREEGNTRATSIRRRPSESGISPFSKRRRSCQRRCLRQRRVNAFRRCVSRCLRSLRDEDSEDEWDAPHVVFEADLESEF